MNDNQDEDESGSADDTALRDALKNSGFRPNADAIQWMCARPRVLVAGAYKVIRTAAEKARKITGHGRG